MSLPPPAYIFKNYSNYIIKIFLNIYKTMSNAINPYGDGTASEKIAAYLQQNL